MKLTVVGNKEEAERAFGQLRDVLTNEAKALSRIVGWPHGSKRRTVYWREEQGFWAVPRRRPDDGSVRFWCAYGTQNPQRRRTLSITVEVNPDRTGLDRRCAGAFLRDAHGHFYLGHSGKLGGGTRGVGKTHFLKSYRGRLATVETPDGAEIQLILIGRVDSPIFLEALAKFIFAVDRFKQKKKNRNIDEELHRAAERALRKGEFDPGGVREGREKLLREVVLRRGQPQFRRNLLRAYGGRCAICGCDCKDALEAAHIRPYGGIDSNHVQNGVLLRSDLHTLFDLGKIGIDPETRRVVIAKSLEKTVYAKLKGQRVRWPLLTNLAPNRDVLREHLENWGLR